MNTELTPTSYYKYEVNENELTVTWYVTETHEVIVSGTKLISNPDYAESDARAFADDLKQNNLDKFPLDPVDPEPIMMGEDTGTSPIEVVSEIDKSDE